MRTLRTRETHRSRSLTARSMASVIVAAALMAYASLGRTAAPPGRYGVTRDTVYDVHTTLSWQRVVSGSTFTWTGAATYCGTLRLAGLDSWRVPTVKELATLVDYSAPLSPSIDATAFPGTPAGQFWSSTALAGVGSTFAWTVDFVGGSTRQEYRQSRFSVRCVRQGR
jgi:hypothetical protein